MNDKLKKIATFGAFLILFPYSVTLCTYGVGGMGGTQEMGKLTSRYQVAVTTPIGTEEINIEEYLVGLIAGCISGTYELETLKAQAVILRTNIMAMNYDVAVEEYLPYEVILSEKIPYTYLDFEKRRALWGEEWETIEGNVREAVKDTKNMVLTYEDRAVELPFFAVCAERTRNGIEVFEENKYPYLANVTCERDVMAPNYLSTYEITWGEMLDCLGMNEESVAKNIEIIKKDSSGYALEIRVGEEIVSGELFRERLGLPSSYLLIEQSEDLVVIHTKGVGHGFGMSQYTANEMAKSENTFIEILHFFYKNVKMQVYA